MRRKKEDYPRYKTSIGVDFHGQDRSLTKDLMAKGKYDALPTAESMRKAIWRGNNAFGDNTSFGYYNSGAIRDSVLSRALESGLGKRFSTWYSKHVKKVSGIDRYRLDEFIRYKTNWHMYMFRNRTPEYTIIDDVITKSNTGGANG